MHISVRVRSGSTRTPAELLLTTRCMSVFVTRGSDGYAEPVPQLALESAEDASLDAHALALRMMRAEPLPIPPELVREA